MDETSHNGIHGKKPMPKGCVLIDLGRAMHLRGRTIKNTSEMAVKAASGVPGCINIVCPLCVGVASVSVKYQAGYTDEWHRAALDRS